MNVKIDTKEKFHVITILEKEIPANMTDQLAAIFRNQFQQEVRNIVVNLSEVEQMEAEAASTIATVQQEAYEAQASFVICHLQPRVEALLEEMGLLEIMNVTPTESEAWDIVQMEEIERELFD